jgi:hypothetical protein
MSATVADPAAASLPVSPGELPPATDRWSQPLALCASLAGRESTRREFLAETLAQLCAAEPVRAAVLWSLDPQGVLACEAECQLASTGISRDPALSRANIRLLLDVVQTASTRCTGDEGGHGPLPPGVAAPLLVGERCVGVLQLLLRGAPPVPPTPSDRLAVEELAGLIAWALGWRDEQQSTTRQLEFLRDLSALQATWPAAPDSTAIALATVNRGRTLLKVDRLSLVLGPGSRPRLAAVTGQETLNQRGDQAAGLRELGRLVLTTGRPLDSQQPAEQWPAPIRTALLNHLHQSGARSVRVVPVWATPDSAAAQQASSQFALGAPSSGERPAQRAAQASPSLPLAALVVEQFQSAWTAPPEERRQHALAAALGPALQRAQSTEAIWLLSTRRVLGRMLQSLASTTGRRWGLGTSLLAAVLAGLAMTPAPYRVEARGRLQPATGRALFAPRDAEVTEVFVTGGERVVAGQPLVQLRDHQLDTELLAARNRVLEKRQQTDAQQAEIDELSRRGNRPDELLRLRGRLVQSQAERRAAEERWEYLEAEAGRLTVRAPLAGTVASFEPGRELSHRPVRRGDSLLEVLDDDGPWRLELRVPESQVGVLQQARAQQAAGQLPVDYVLATNPEVRHAAVLDRVATRTSVAPERGTVLDVTAQIAAAPTAPMGTEVVAKIDCGPHPLLFVVFGDFYHLVLRTLW